MKEILLQYADYNIWANKLIIDTILKLKEGVAEQEVASSFPSLKATVLHIWSAESVWLQRLLLTEHPVWVQGAFTGTIQEACDSWQKVSADIKQFVTRQFDDNALAHVVMYSDLKGNQHKTPVYQVLHHVFNHATYHRGQLVTILRSVGVTDLPSTDFIRFVRK